MLFDLIFKYFFHNKKRTYRAVAILTIGIAIVMSTDMLMSGYISQIEEFASVLDVRSNYIVISPKIDQDFSPSTLTAIREIHHSHPEITYIEYYLTFAETIDGTWLNFELLIADTVELRDLGWIDYTHNRTEFPLISTKTELHSYFTVVPFSIKTSNIELNASEIQEYTPLKEITSEVIVDRSLDIVDGDLGAKRNRVYMSIGSDEVYTNIVRELKKIDTIEVELENPANRFLKISGSQVTKILLLLQVAMSFLLILSISYVMISLVQDSEEDIRIMKMIGLGRNALFMVFMGQSIMAAVFASITAFFFSIGMLFTLLAFLATFGLPYGVLTINLPFVFITFAQAIGIGVVSGIYPSYMGSK